ILGRRRKAPFLISVTALAPTPTLPRERVRGPNGEEPNGGGSPKQRKQRRGGSSPLPRLRGRVGVGATVADRFRASRATCPTTILLYCSVTHPPPESP